MYKNFIDITSTLTINTTYIQSSFYSLYTNGAIYIFNLNFNIKTSVPANTDIITGFNVKYTVYGSAGHASGQCARFRILPTRGLHAEDVLATGWYDGNITFFA